MAVDSACFNRLPSLKLSSFVGVGDTLSVSSVITPVTLTFDLLTSNLVRVAREVGIHLNFDLLRTFRSRLMGHISLVFFRRLF